MALPQLPSQGQNPWYTPRTNWDNAVKAELEGRLSESELDTAIANASTEAVIDANLTPLETTQQLGTAFGLIEMRNILTNSIFERGVEGWLGGNGTISAVDGVAEVTGSGSTSNFAARPDAVNVFTAAAGDVLYMATEMRAVEPGATALALMLESSAGSYRVNQVIHSNPVAGAWMTLSGRYQVSSTWGGLDLNLRPSAFWGTPASAGGKHLQISRVVALNLTTIFGPGDEPTLVEMDDWLASLPHRSLDPVAWWPASTEPPPTPPVIISDSRTFFRKGQSGVLIRFDDGYENIRTLAAPYMAERGMLGYMAACPGIPGHEFIAGRVMQNNQLVELHAMGWEIGNHVSNHATIAAPDFLAQVDLGSRQLVDLGLPYPNTFTYPTGARSAVSDREMYFRFNQAQLTFEPNTTAIRHNQPVFHSGWTIISGTATPQRRAEQIARMKRYVSGSIRNGLVPILAFHQVLAEGETPVLETQVQWEVFTEVIDWLFTEGIPTILPRDLPTHNLLVDAGFNEFPVLGFDASAYPWGAAAATGVWSRVTTGQHSGLGALRVQSATPVSGSVSQGIAVEPGKTYRAHMLSSVESVTSGTIGLRIRPRLMYGDSVGPDLDIITISAATSGYEDHTATFTVPEGTSNASVFVRAEGFQGTAYVDNVAIFPVELTDFIALGG